MKQLWIKLGQLSLITLLSIMLAGCNKKHHEDDTPIWDFIPLSIDILVLDKDGNNLLEINNVGYGSDYVKVEYEGKMYPIIEPSSYIRAIPVKFYGLGLYGLSKEGGSKVGRWLSFGEFPRTKSAERILTLHWADGKVDVIRQLHVFTWKDNYHSYDNKTQTFLNGKEQPKGYIRIIR